MKARTLMALILISIVVAACGGEPPSNENEGVEGRVWVEPICPSDRICLDEPLQANLTIRDLAGEVVVRSESDGDGFYRIELPPGDYILVPELLEEDAITQAQPVPIYVNAGAWTQVTVVYRSVFE